MSDNDKLFDTRNVIDLLEIWQAKAKPVVIWAGAGLSAPAKLPTWPDLFKSLITDARKQATALDGENRQRRNKKLDDISKIPSLWSAFEAIEELDPPWFQAVIRQELVNVNHRALPISYKSIWDLGVRGVLTLNIDGFATRGFKESSAKDLHLIEKDGFDVRTLLGVITDNNRRFVANLHGSPDNPENWVFTESKLTRLFSDKNYSEFIRDCVKYTTIVLMGVSAQDKAIIEHFRKTMKEVPNAGPHFWVTNSDNYAYSQSVSEAGIRSVFYSNSDGGHKFISDLIDKVKSFKSAEYVVEPVAPMTGRIDGDNDSASPLEIISKTPNEIRRILNSMATEIIRDSSDGSYEKFEEFCGKYSRAIHAANYVSGNQEEEAGKIGRFNVDAYQREGGFARVWYGYDDKNMPVAIKVFRHEVRDQPQLLRGFRRGVRSMRMLQQRGIPGVVGFIDAFEMPPVVVMEWINGVTLFDAIRQGFAKDWGQRLRVATRLAKIVHEVHCTPERVVHRDIRPQNIMLRDFYEDSDTCEVVVLDFDLSWHVGALEKSVYIAGGTAYLAPEQLNDRDGVSTRSAAVDSFGFGMTLYFMLSGMDPEFFAHARGDWEKKIDGLCRSKSCREWKSLPRRFSRLIVGATLDNQNRRLTFSQIASELDKMSSLLTGEWALGDVDLAGLAEEIFSRVALFDGYSVVSDGSVSYASPSGLGFTISPHQGEAAVIVQFSFMQKGHEKFEVMESIGSAFRGLRARHFKGFDVFDDYCDISYGNYRAGLAIRVSEEPGFIARMVDSLDHASETLVKIASSY